MSGGFIASLFKKKVEEEEPSNLGLARVIKYDVLKKATNSFGTEIGSGGFGRVYLGKLRDQMVAVKILYDRNPKRLEQFFNEVTVLSSLRHKNLVTLYGCTNPRSQELLLVYDYVPNGTVADHLHGQQSTLSWAVRIQIALETAEALAYLHAREPPVIHRDVKTPNILLDHAFHVKVADLGMCRLMPYDATHVTTVPQGTMGYRDPEYDRYLRISNKTDVYSFGVVLMELVSGQEAVDVNRDPENIYLDGMARNKILNKKLEELVDPNLGYHSNNDVRRTINSVAELANECLLPTGELRPSMAQVVTILKGIQNEIKQIVVNEVDVASFAPQLEGIQNDIQQIGLNEVDVASLAPRHELNNDSLNKGTDHSLGPNEVDVASFVPKHELNDDSLNKGTAHSLELNEVDVAFFAPQRELNDGSLNKDQVSPAMRPATTPVMMPVMTPTTIDPVLLDDIINRLLEVRMGRVRRQVPLSEAEIRQLCIMSRDIFISQPCLLELEAPIKVCGDIHGQYSDLLRLFKYGGFPPKANYLFMGNYVDHGAHSLETICLLLAYKIKYPEDFFLLRGNHECASINRVHGFYDECKRLYNVRVWKVFIDCFNCLPVAALINDKILCMHGGLSPDLTNLDQIRNLRRPTDIPDTGLLCDLLWSDPARDVLGWGMNDRGVSYTFGPDKVSEFLFKHDLDLVCRGHQVVEDGYEFFADKQLLTIFSAPNYRGEYDNSGAMLSIDEALMCSFQILKHAEKKSKYNT